MFHSVTLNFIKSKYLNQNVTPQTNCVSHVFEPLCSLCIRLCLFCVSLDAAEAVIFPPQTTKTPLWPYLIKCYSCPDLVVYNERGKYIMIFDRATRNTIQYQLFICVFLTVSWQQINPCFTPITYKPLQAGSLWEPRTFNLKFCNTVMRPLVFYVNGKLVLK